MIKRNILSLVLTFLFVQTTFSQDTLYLNKDWNATIKDSASFYRVFQDSLNFIVCKDYYISGALQMVALTKSKNPIIKFGIVKTYNENGTIESVCNYKSNKLNGKCINYFPNGRIDYEGNYLNDKMDGKFIAYYPNGNISLITNFKKNVAYSTSKFFYEDGSLQREEDYVNGIVVKYRVYDNNGNLTTTFDYKYKLSVPSVKQKLRFKVSRWTQVDVKDDDSFEYQGMPIRDQNGKTFMPPKLFIYIFDNTDSLTIEKKYSELLMHINANDIRTYSFPIKLSSKYYNCKTFLKNYDSNSKARWVSVLFQSTSKKVLLMVFGVNENFWESQAKEFNDVLLNFK